MLCWHAGFLSLAVRSRYMYISVFKPHLRVFVKLSYCLPHSSESCSFILNVFFLISSQNEQYLKESQWNVMRSWAAKSTSNSALTVWKSFFLLLYVFLCGTRLCTKMVEKSREYFLINICKNTQLDTFQCFERHLSFCPIIVSDMSLVLFYNWFIIQNFILDSVVLRSPIMWETGV